MFELEETKIQEKNIFLYKWSNYISSSVLIWTVVTLYYLWRGLNYFDIALVQSFGSIAVAILEIPTGWISDRYGHHKVLKIAAFSRLAALITLTLANNIFWMIFSEFLFSLANASQSGAGSAFLYESVSFISKDDDKSKLYALILSKITGVQSVIRIFVRLIAPLLFGINPLIPFILSIAIYFISYIFSMMYRSSKASNCNLQLQSTIKISDGFTIKNKILSAFNNFIKVFRGIISNHYFLVLCMVSSISLVLVSNYSQFVAPNLTSMGFDIKFYGFVTAGASLGELFGSRLIALFIKKYSKSDAICLKKEKSSFYNIEMLFIFVLAILMSILILAYGKFANIILCIIIYIVINLLSTMLNILLNKQMNQVANGANRATLLSVSNQLDEIISVIFDPIIGFGLDVAGFGTVYILLGLFSILLLGGIVFYYLIKLDK